MSNREQRDLDPHTIVGGRAPGRNEPCPCGSGLKFKKCHNNPVFKQNAFEEAKNAYANAMAGQIGEALARKKGEQVGLDTGQPNVWKAIEHVEHEETKHE